MSKGFVSINKFLEEGKTKLVPLPESVLFPVEIKLLREVWQEGELKGQVRSLYGEITCGEDHVVVAESSVHELLRRIGRILLALTEGR